MIWLANPGAEVIVAVCMVLAKFDIETIRFVEDNGSPREEFPSLKPSLNGTAGIGITGDILVRMSQR